MRLSPAPELGCSAAEGARRGTAMRLTLIDLVVLGGLFLAGVAVSTPALFIARPLAVAPFGVACGIAAVLTGASPVYRRLYFRPLFVPVCPHCHRRPQFYRLRLSEWPLEVAACGSCEAVTVLRYPACPPPEVLKGPAQ